MSFQCGNNAGNAILVTVPRNASGIVTRSQVLRTTVQSDSGYGSFVSLALGVDIDDDSAALDADISGLLRYGTGGASRFVEFDWLEGLQLSVPASSLDLSVQIESLDDDNEFTANFSAFVVPYNSARPASEVQPVRRTIVVSSLAAGATSTPVRVPSMASTFQIVPVSNVDPFDLTVLGSFDVGATRTTGRFVGQTQSQELSGRIRYLSFINNSANAATFNVLFGLTL